MAGTKLAWMKRGENDGKESISEIRHLLATYRENVSAEYFAWGEYLLAQLITDSEPPEAERILKRLSEDKQLSDYRRSWAGYDLAVLLESRSGMEAIKVLRNILPLDTEASPHVFTLLVKLLALEGQMAEVRSEIQKVMGRQPESRDALLMQLAESVGTLLPDSRAETREELILQLIETEKSVDPGEGFREALKSSRNLIRAVTASREIKARLAGFLKENPRSSPVLDGTKLENKADFASAIAQAEGERSSNLAFACSLEYLLRFEPEAEFPAALWRAANMADWKERHCNEPEPLLPLLLDLCDLLPHENESYLEGRFLRAKVADRRGDIEGAKKLHENILEEPSLPAAFRVTALRRLAGNFEALHLYAKALEIYRKIETQLVYISVKDDLLRAALLNLELGNRSESLRILSLLRSENIANIREAKTAWQIEQMIALTGDETSAEKYWSGSEKWWADWLKLEQKLGLAPLGDEKVIPIFANLSGFCQEMESALSRKDSVELFTKLRFLAHGARWQSSLLPVLTRFLAYQGPTLAGDAANEMRQLTLAIYENFESDDLKIAPEIQMHATIGCIDSNLNDRALELIHAYHRKAKPEDRCSEVMSRLWAMMARRVKSEMPPAIAALEAMLKHPKKLEYRALSVTFLADLYRESGRAADEEELLKQELDHPEIKAAAADLKTLTERYSQLTDAVIDSKRRVKAVERWLAKNKPAWFDFAEPKSLGDPRLSNLDQVFETGGNFADPEIIKLTLLVACDPEQPFGRWDVAFVEALKRLSSYAHTKEEARSLIEPEIDNQDLPEQTRIGLLWIALMNASKEEDAVHFDKLRKHPLNAKFSENGRAIADFRREALAVDRSSGKAINSFCINLLEGELTPLKHEELKRCFLRLLEMDQIDLADQVYKKLTEVSATMPNDSSLISLQMGCLKSLNHFKLWRPAVNAMRDIVLHHFPESQTAEPEFYGTLSDPLRLGFLSEAAATKARLYQIATRQVDLTNIEFWKEFIRDWDPTEARSRLTLDLASAALQRLPGDAEKAMIIMSFCFLMDLDDPKVNEAMVSLVKPFRDAEQFPASSQMIRMFEVQSKWRKGEMMELERSLSTLRGPNSDNVANYFRLSFYLQRKDASLIRKAIDAYEASDLLSERLLALSLRAFELAGMSEEFALARRAATKASYHAILKAWATLDPKECQDAYDLPLAMSDASVVPKAWFENVTSRLGGQRVRDSLRVSDAALHEDWNRLLQATTEAIPRFPTLYQLYWYKGAALYHLGRHEEAAEPLGVFAKYSKNELEYPQCMAWLESIAKGQSSKRADGVPALHGH